jgi:hypothetical protein
MIKEDIVEIEKGIERQGKKIIIEVKEETM